MARVLLRALFRFLFSMSRGTFQDRWAYPSSRCFYLHMVSKCFYLRVGRSSTPMDGLRPRRVEGWACIVSDAEMIPRARSFTLKSLSLGSSYGTRCWVDAVAR